MSAMQLMWEREICDRPQQWGSYWLSPTIMSTSCVALGIFCGKNTRQILISLHFHSFCRTDTSLSSFDNPVLYQWHIAYVQFSLSPLVAQQNKIWHSPEGIGMRICWYRLQNFAFDIQNTWWKYCNCAIRNGPTKNELRILPGPYRHLITPTNTIDTLRIRRNKKFSKI